MQKHTNKHAGSHKYPSLFCLIHVNSTNYPLDGLKCTLWLSCFGYHKYTPYIYAYKTLLKTVEKYSNLDLPL